MKKRASIFQEERKTTTSRRDFSADEIQYRSKILKEQKSIYDAATYGSKKKYDEGEDQDSLINKCMLSWPNKFSLEQLKKH